MSEIDEKSFQGLSWHGTRILASIREAIAEDDLGTALELLITLTDTCVKIPPYARSQKCFYLKPKKVFGLIKDEFLPRIFKEDKMALEKHINEFREILSHPLQLMKEKKSRERAQEESFEEEIEEDFEDFNL